VAGPSQVTSFIVQFVAVEVGGVRLPVWGWAVKCFANKAVNCLLLPPEPDNQVTLRTDPSEIVARFYLGVSPTAAITWNWQSPNPSEIADLVLALKANYRFPYFASHRRRLARKSAYGKKAIQRFLFA
jgi:hypothetical protein